MQQIIRILLVIAILVVLFTPTVSAQENESSVCDTLEDITFFVYNTFGQIGLDLYLDLFPSLSPSSCAYREYQATLPSIATCPLDMRQPNGTCSSRPYTPPGQ